MHTQLVYEQAKRLPVPVVAPLALNRTQTARPTLLAATVFAWLTGACSFFQAGQTKTLAATFEMKRNQYAETQ